MRNLCDMEGSWVLGSAGGRHSALQAEGGGFVSRWDH
jgi:hypothetical protein